MEDLCYLLKNVKGAGVFRLNCSLEALHDSVRRADFAFFEADIATAHGKGEVLAEMARAIKAPDWFGHNWDALADALGDLRGIPLPALSCCCTVSRQAMQLWTTFSTQRYRSGSCRARHSGFSLCNADL